MKEVSAKSPFPAFLAQRRIRKALFLLPSAFCLLSSVGCKMTFCTRFMKGNIALLKGYRQPSISILNLMSDRICVSSDGEMIFQGSVMPGQNRPLFSRLPVFAYSHIHNPGPLSESIPVT
jgi:hypothetical protein